MVKVVLKDVSKNFGDVKAVDKFNLEVGDGEFVAILGPSGCGKTTFLRLIAGLETLTEGEILFGGRVMNEVPPRERNVSMVFQSYALFPNMTVAENIGFPLSVRGVPTEEVASRVREVADLLKISGLLKRRPRELSGGEQQRVALGRAIVRKPDVLLMDEPLSNVDVKIRIYLRVELKELQKSIKTTLLYVTHDQTEAMTMADRIAVMNQGQTVQIGTPEEVYDHPKNIWVASFIGSLPMNFFDCTLIEKGGVKTLAAAYFEPRLPAEAVKMLEGFTDGAKFKLGVRPEDIEITKSETSNSTCEAEVRLTEPLGESVIVDLVIGEVPFKAKARPGFKAEPREKVCVNFDWSRAHLFSGDTELSIF